jgi:hypothetical protein
MPKKATGLPGMSPLRDTTSDRTSTQPALTRLQRPLWNNLRRPTFQQARHFGLRMPRYFFHLIGVETERDLVGTEFENDAAARQEAMLRSLNGRSFRLQKYRNHQFIEVRDEDDRLICRRGIEH